MKAARKGDAQASQGRCQMCLQITELRMSHIIPQFVTDWLRDTNRGALLRCAPSPNLRVQDSRRERWFCDACEGRMSEHEGWFASHLFKLPRTPFVLPDDLSLYQFAAGLVFRGLLFLQQEQRIPDIALSRVNALREELRQVVLNNDAANRPALWLLATDFLPELPPHPEFLGVPWHRYLQRSADIELLLPETPALAMVRIPRFAFFASVDLVNQAEVMATSRLHANGSHLHLRDAGRHTPALVTYFLASQAKGADAVFDGLSPKQAARTTRKLDEIGTLPLIASPSGAAALLDYLRAEGIDPSDALAAPCLCGEATPFRDCHGGALEALVSRSSAP